MLAKTRSDGRYPSRKFDLGHRPKATLLFTNGAYRQSFRIAIPIYLSHSIKPLLRDRVSDATKTIQELDPRIR